MQKYFLVRFFKSYRARTLIKEQSVRAYFSKI